MGEGRDRQTDRGYRQRHRCQIFTLCEEGRERDPAGLVAGRGGPEGRRAGGVRQHIGEDGIKGAMNANRRCPQPGQIEDSFLLHNNVGVGFLHSLINYKQLV